MWCLLWSLPHGYIMRFNLSFWESEKGGLGPWLGGHRQSSTAWGQQLGSAVLEV
jgi:hypothetical protein